MPLFILAIPITTEKLMGLKRLGNSRDYNIEIYISGIGDEGQLVIDSLREVIVQAIIACDEDANGSRN
jgi:ribosomal protein S9